jgi:hypothetical protein
MSDGIEAALERAERALDEGRGLAGSGFWAAVAEMRRDPALAERYADRVAPIDRRAFEAGVRLRLPIGAGLAILMIGTLAGVGALLVTCKLSGTLQTIVFLGAFGVLVGSTHSLAHYVVGRALGIRFTHVFIAGSPPEPGVKIDYVTYLRASPGARAVMLASGAVVTKLVPFVLVPIALGMNAWRGVVWILLAVGVLIIVTDVLISTKTSDWMKVRRELRARRGLGG